tara:strand:+ start:102 stop:497 length:396 start_codon:yes stop_codon:yes gene_type:complete
VIGITVNKMTVFGLAAIIMLPGCLSPRAQCVSDAKIPQRLAMKERGLVAQNLGRGYAIHKQQVPYSYQGQCQDANLKYYPCIVNGYRTQETPVPIDMKREEAKLRKLDARISLILESESRQLAQCALLPDE